MKLVTHKFFTIQRHVMNFVRYSRHPKLTEKNKWKISRLMIFRDNTYKYNPKVMQYANMIKKPIDFF